MENKILHSNIVIVLSKLANAYQFERSDVDTRYQKQQHEIFI